MLFIHLFIAVLSIITASFGLIFPNKKLVQANIVLIPATLISGGFLVIVTSSPLLTACQSGLIYLAVIGTLTYLSASRLSKTSRS